MDTKTNELTTGAVTRDAIARMAPLLAPHIRRTPVVQTTGADFSLPPFSLAMKMELLQHSGSFKARGAFANLLTRQVPSAGVVAASGGNHGVAVAYAAMKLGVRAKIFVPEIASPAKLARIRQYGADLKVTSGFYADALAASEEWVRQSGALAIHAFDQIETLLGQGTLGMELENQIESFDTLLIPVGGGGLIGGLAAWYGRRVKIVGVEPETAPTLTKALEAGRPVDAEAGGIAADSLAPRRVGELTFPLAQRFVDRVVLVEDQAIKNSQQALWEILRIAAEPGGAASFAALLSGKYTPQKDERVALVISGGNTGAVDFNR
jgi:threonine dehydratase